MNLPQLSVDENVSSLSPPLFFQCLPKVNAGLEKGVRGYFLCGTPLKLTCFRAQFYK